MLRETCGGGVACAWAKRAIGSDIIDNYNIMGISNMLPHYFVGRSVVQA